MRKYITISEATTMLGVSVCTLRRWDKENKLKSDIRTIGNHRRYLLSKIIRIINPKKGIKRVSICYSRVSSYDQKADLERQSMVLKEYAINQNILNLIEIKDLGSGLNFKKKGLKN